MLSLRKESTLDIVEQLNNEGFACIEGAISGSWLESARSHVKKAINEHGEKYFSVIRPGDEQGSPFAELTSHPDLLSLLKDLTVRGCSSGAAEGSNIYDVLRVIAGPKGDSGSLAFHYDASAITALVPIFMPENAPGKSGELVILANRRPFRKSLIINFFEKIVFQNKFARKRFNERLLGNEDEFVRILYPGNIYLFWGYRSYHGNLPCAPHSLRATMLLHYGNPHGNAVALRLVRTSRRLFEAVRRRVK
jgi:hypothetical protein